MATRTRSKDVKSNSKLPPPPPDPKLLKSDAKVESNIAVSSENEVKPSVEIGNSNKLKPEQSSIAMEMPLQGAPSQSVSVAGAAAPKVSDDVKIESGASDSEFESASELEVTADPPHNWTETLREQLQKDRESIANPKV